MPSVIFSIKIPSCPSDIKRWKRANNWPWWSYKAIVVRPSGVSASFFGSIVFSSFYWDYTDFPLLKTGHECHYDIWCFEQKTLFPKDSFIRGTQKMNQKKEGWINVQPSLSLHLWIGSFCRQLVVFTDTHHLLICHSVVWMLGCIGRITT